MVILEISWMGGFDDFVGESFISMIMIMVYNCILVKVAAFALFLLKHLKCCHFIGVWTLSSVYFCWRTLDKDLKIETIDNFHLEKVVLACFNELNTEEKVVFKRTMNRKNIRHLTVLGEMITISSKTLCSTYTYWRRVWFSTLTRHS